MSLKIRFFNFSILVLFSSSLLALDSFESRLKKIEDQLDSFIFINEGGEKGIKTTIVKNAKNGTGANFFIDTLFWKSKMDGLAFASIEKSYQNQPINLIDQVIEPHFRWDFGVKIGGGYQFDYDGWDLFLDYTYFKNKGFKSKKTTLPSGLNLLDTNLLPLTAYSQYNAKNSLGTAGYAANCSSNASLFYNNLNLQLGRHFFISEKFTLHPSFGLQSNWISIKQHQLFSGGENAFSLLVRSTIVALRGLDSVGSGSYLSYIKKCTSVGVGPRIGIRGNWVVHKAFMIYGSIQESLLFSYIKKRIHGTYSVYPLNVLDSTYNYHRLIPASDLEIGFSYAKSFNNQRQKLNISLGYEAQYYFNLVAIQLERITTSLGLYGANLKVSLDF